ncbi:hypothetical protein ACTXMV_09760 [Psychrobacter celer]|uniref:hypothetical protein n=1 Tax=Psychrobacter TaxID=497 RepID=UPI000ED5CF85|nr:MULTISPECIES: hypothetical protein [Psychrobacter]HCH26658.1 hypothetical protein [Psychrobacter sp.]
MKQILRHSFEAVSLLTTNHGMLDVTFIPAFNQPDWIIPSGLILSIEDTHERASSYHWQQQVLPVFDLLTQEQTPDKMIILEGNTIEHRMALQTSGQLYQRQVGISDVKDTDRQAYFADSDSTDKITAEGRFTAEGMLSYLFQTVMIEDTVYVVPDLEKIAHQLVEMDS